MKIKKWSSQWTQFMQLRTEAWKKFRTSTGFEPVTSRCRCDALPTEATDVGSRSVVGSYVPVKEMIVNDTAVSRKVVGKCARDNPERYCGCFLVHCFSKKFQRMTGEARDVCLRVLKESNKGRFDSYSVRNKCIDHIPYYLSGLSYAKFLRQPFSK